MIKAEDSITGRTNFRDRLVSRANVNPLSGDKFRGWIHFGNSHIPVALGRSGIIANKREGDGGTPRGIYRPLRLWYRADRHNRPITRLPVRIIKPSDAWCEDPNDRRYNRRMALAAGQPGDRLTRDDHLYDFIIEIDHNARPHVPWRGSAVFLHLARPGYTPTAGCVAMSKSAMLHLLRNIGTETEFHIGMV